MENGNQWRRSENGAEESLCGEHWRRVSGIDAMLVSTVKDGL